VIKLVVKKILQGRSGMLTRDLFAVAMPFLFTMFINEQVVNIAVLELLQ